MVNMVNMGASSYSSHQKIIIWDNTDTPASRQLKRRNQAKIKKNP